MLRSSAAFWNPCEEGRAFWTCSREQGRRLAFTESPAAFNNEYFQEVLLWEQRQKMPKPKTRYKERAESEKSSPLNLLPSDIGMLFDPGLHSQVERFAADEAAFFAAFASGYRFTMRDRHRQAPASASSLNVPIGAFRRVPVGSEDSTPGTSTSAAGLRMQGEDGPLLTTEAAMLMAGSVLYRPSLCRRDDMEDSHSLETTEKLEADSDLSPPGSGRAGRPMCEGCGRPVRTCICASLPSEPLALPSGLESVLLLRHPKERRQKHQSAWILERCVRGVRQHVTRRLPSEVPIGLEHLYREPESCLLVFPGPGARPLKEVLDAKVRHLILVDATWRFAREMAAVSESGDPLSRIQRVELTPPSGTRPVFVVRKPLLLGNTRELEAADGHDFVASEDERWGFSTAEAAALALDEISELRTPDATSKECSRLAWRTVAAALGAYAQIQLDHTAKPRMRTDRPGFIPKLYEAAQEAAAADGDE
ncbi:Dtwd2 [Symbiodinium necroappetens]|uniref:tRNA-uridine aminocarboxypropyltransferase n=1 Tax=Symbiodinium necroappetens TaxID=1628268 RepID=A0A813BU36_9DINO|nr:Dtwd2 [Symbiodinium necroappetens]